MDELKPCPFCGEAGLLSAYPFDNPNRYMVECSNCDCAVGKEYDNWAMPDFKYETEGDAVAAWNRRAKQQR